MKVIESAVLAALTLIATGASAAFEEANAPVSVKALYCDSSPRILGRFADPSKNVCYPAGAGDQSKAHLATALAAKASGQKLYCYGLGDPATLTTHCINVAARQIAIFGLE